MKAIYETDAEERDEWIVIVDVVSLDLLFRGKVPADFISELSADSEAAYYESEDDEPGEKGSLVEETGIAAHIFDRAGSKHLEVPWYTIHLDTTFDAFIQKYADRNKLKPKPSKKRTS